MPNHLHDALLRPHHGSESVFLHLPGGGIWTYGNFLDTAGRHANTLHSLGLRPGDRLAVQVAKSPEALALYAAAVAAGVVFMPLNPAYTAAELGYFLGNSEARLMLCDPANEAALRSVAGDASLLTLGADGTGSFADRAAAEPAGFDPVDRGPDDLAALLYTSGTTGRSKGAMLTHDNLLSNARALTGLWRFGPGDTLLHALPIFHTHGLFVASNICLIAGAAMIFLPRFDVDAVIAALPRATAMMGVPTFYTRLLDDPRLDRGLVGHMRLFVSGSAPLLAETHARWTERTGHEILERYGMTETNMNTSIPYDGPRLPGTVGKPLPKVEVRICDEAGAEVPQGEIGVLEVRGPNVFKGYWRMPEKTAEELRPDGFFITGDMARITSEGYVEIVGRAKDLIIAGGYNIYPKEIEDVLDAQPGVRESAVIGVPHADLGEAVVALLVAEDDAHPNIDAIRADLESRLARFKHPRRIEVVDELPRNALGKVQKAALRESYAESFAPASRT